MEFFELGDLTLASGETLPDARLAYQTFGELNAAGDNAIVFPTFLGAPPEVLNGWIGEGRALDPTRYFIVLPGHFGLAPSSAPSNAAAPANGPQFPTVSIVDDVVAQRRLVESLGVRSVALVLGWSVGGLQVYEWALRQADIVRAFAGIATAPTPPPWTKLWLKTVVEDPIKADPKWAGGSYASGADVKTGMTGVAHGSALTAPPRSFYFGSNEGWRGLGFGSVDEFVAGFWEGFWVPQDPNDTLVQARKARTAYPGPADEELRDILGRVKPRATVAAFTGDALFPPAEGKQLADWMGVDFHEIDTPFGHLATFALSEADVKAIDGVIRTALGD